MPPTFYLKKPNKRGESPIYYSYAVFGFRVRKSIGFSIPPATWNKKHFLVKNTHPLSDKINSTIDAIKTRSAIVKLDYIAKFEKPTGGQFLSDVFNFHIKSLDIFKAFEEYIKEKSQIVAPNSIKIYNSTFSGLKAWNPKLKQIDNKILADFTNHLIKSKKSMNYVIKQNGIIIDFAKSINRKLESSLNERKRKTYEIALSLDDLNKIKSLVIPDRHQDLVRDVFLFCCYTGLRNSDLSRFEPSFIKEIDGVRCLSFFASKKASKSVVPLMPETEVILKKHGGYFKKIPTINEINKHIKSIAMDAGLVETIQKPKSQGIQDVVIAMPKYQAITSHTARRTFVTNMSHLGFTTKEIGLMVGQRQQAITESYDKSTPEVNAVKVFKRLVK